MSASNCCSYLQVKWLRVPYDVGKIAAVLHLNLWGGEKKWAVTMHIIPTGGNHYSILYVFYPLVVSAAEARAVTDVMYCQRQKAP